MDFDLSTLNSQEDFEKYFLEIAHTILNEYVLTINHEYKYRIAEIELYFNDSNKHQDTFTHGNKDQAKPGSWYFHKFGSSYKSGTYKGLDLAFGKDKIAFAGILIRSL